VTAQESFGIVRVAKPGSLLLVSDETEEQVKSAYEHNLPVTSNISRIAKEVIAAPIVLRPR